MLIVEKYAHDEYRTSPPPRKRHSSGFDSGKFKDWIYEGFKQSNAPMPESTHRYKVAGREILDFKNLKSEHVLPLVSHTITIRCRMSANHPVYIEQTFMVAFAERSAARSIHTRPVHLFVSAPKESEAAMITHISRVPEGKRKEIFACQTEDDWDDEGAVGITFQACESAAQFLEEVLGRDSSIPMPRISPSVFGSVTLHWRKDGKHLIVRPSSDPNLAYYRQEEPDSISSYGDESREQVIQCVLQFFGADHAEDN